MPDDASQEHPGSRRWVFSTTGAFLVAAAILRSVLEFDGAQLGLVVGLLAVWSLLTVTEPAVSRRLPWYFPVYIVLQAAVILVLLGQSDGSDYFGILLAVPSMRAIQRWQVRSALVLVALFAILVVLGVVEEYGPAEAVAMATVYSALSLFLGSYALTAKRATEARATNEALAADLREANRRLAESAARAERLAGARERQRLARDLHDSVTQTLFSMTLAAHSATLMLARRRQALGAQLDQIEHLGASARAELKALSAALPSALTGEGDLAASIQRHLGERAGRDGLEVTFVAEGDRRLPPAAEEAVLRIVQEALNNVVKHAGVAQVEVRLRLRRPARVEIEDHGRGFAPDSAGRRGAGLGIMEERAAEVGWRLTVTSSPGGGALVVAQEVDDEADAAHGAASEEADEGGEDRG